MVKTPVSDSDKAHVLSTSASSSATKRSRKKKGVARQRRRTIRASMRNKGPQQTIQHSQSTTLSEQSHTINDVDSDRVNKRTARALRMEKLIKKRVATPKKLNVAASGSRSGGRYRHPVVNKWDLVTCPDCKAIVWNAEAVVQETQNSPRSLIKMLDEYNPLAKTFRHARDRILSGDTVEFSITLVNQKHRGRQYDLPAVGEIGGLLVGDFTADSAGNPTFAEEDVEVIEPAIPQSAAERSGDKDATTSNVAEQSTVATDAEGTEQAARKKARVE
ncbi:hypothetical protein F2Q69_00025342 [Brassica cretica]|uniref:Replication factor A C-terminal domain-containing protein n=1 Tax=Brassica cretica TaxID=69181 RepID=A0A8S9Q690_BRACR|nr:hypothetical protein F2Q69_00025342 [Brassica cretica]